ncbi:hypothetical protein LL947_05040 [Halomonas sp. BLK-85]
MKTAYLKTSALKKPLSPALDADVLKFWHKKAQLQLNYMNVNAAYID